ncbi:MAG: CDP-diacylglycerol--glycerol-3-phosphate 3-phosphatidyltransferase [Chthoniobacteraceae bacterium]|nr:CDP-diacylglycerol--glycerol-3-phosphate 3-phosphatidyltransferase [Chthoniobacteraceae bacterium]
MTLANQITLARILAIPVFVTMAVYYGLGVQEGQPHEWQRIAAIAVFILAAVSDGLDGYIARHYNQRTRLGLILDPIADKGLLLAGLFTLTFSNWHYGFPLWFPILVISRDSLVVAGALLLHFLNGKVRIRPRWTGKAATALQMLAITAAMLQNDHPGQTGATSHPWMDGLVAAAGLFTFLSGIGYVVDGIRQLQAGDHANA